MQHEVAITVRDTGRILGGGDAGPVVELQLRGWARGPVAPHAAPLDVEGRPPTVHHPDGRWKALTVGGIELFNLETVPVTRYRYRGNTIPNPWTLRNHTTTAGTVESPVR